MRRLIEMPVILCAVIACLVCTRASAQQTTTDSKTVHFTVVAVTGNTVTVKTREKGAEEITVPDDFRFTVDGKQVSARELQPGMAGTATITTTTTTTPVVITEVKNATVSKVVGNSIVVQNEKGYQMFTEADAAKRGVEIIKDGQKADFASLREGDRLTATIVTTHPPKVMTKRQVEANLSAPVAAAAGAASEGATAATKTSHAPAAAHAPGAASTSGETPHKKLPKTASPFPLVGLIGLVLCATAMLLGALRRRAAGY
jgi:hypothetical protein